MEQKALMEQGLIKVGIPRALFYYQ